MVKKDFIGHSPSAREAAPYPEFPHVDRLWLERRVGLELSVVLAAHTGDQKELEWKCVLDEDSNMSSRGWSCHRLSPDGAIWAAGPQSSELQPSP